MIRKIIAGLLLSGSSIAMQAQTLQVTAAPAPIDSARRFDLISGNLLSQGLAAAPTDSLRARAIKMHSRWTGFWESRFSYSVPAGTSIFTAHGIGMETFITRENNLRCLGTDKSRWSYLGPKHNFFNASEDKCGKVTALWIDPQNQQYMLAGSPSGGLFKTLNGGRDWKNITDNAAQSVPGTMGIRDIAVSPNNYQIIYLSTGNFASGSLATANLWGDSYGLGLMYSRNLGNNWAFDADFKARVEQAFPWVDGAYDKVTKLAFSSYSNKLYAVYKNRVYMRSDFSTQTAVNPWQDITPSGANVLPQPHVFSDFDFDPVNKKVVFSSYCIGNTQYLLRFDEITLQWERRVIIVPGHNNQDAVRDFGIQSISLNKVNDVYMRLVLNRQSDASLKSLLCRYNWNTGVLTTVNPDLGLSVMAPSKLIVSPEAPERIYMTTLTGGSDFLYRSENGGATFSSVAFTHADGRSPVLYKSTNTAKGIGDIFYCGTDGGVSMKAAGTMGFVSLSGNGLDIAEIVSLSTSPSYDGLLTAGVLDNGTQAYVKHDLADPWKFPKWGDGLMTAFAGNGNLSAFSQSQNGFNSPIVFNRLNGNVGNSSTTQPGELHQNKWWKPVRFDYQNLARVGYFFIWQKGLNPGEQWEPTYGSMLAPTEPKPLITIDDATKFNRDEKVAKKLVRDFFVSETNPDIGYIAYGQPNWGELEDGRIADMEGKLFFTKDHGQNWTNVTPPYMRQFQINDIEVDVKSPNRIWLALGGVHWDELGVPVALRTARVLYHNNHGLDRDRWIDRSKGLPPMPVIKLLYVEGSDDLMFAATDVGVYRWNKTLLQWECFNNGMPRCMVSDMDLNYCSGKLRVSTMGRGIWETDYADNLATLQPGYVHTIEGSVTWNSSRTVHGSILVKAGATFVIRGSNTTIFMPRMGQITVEVGGHLIIDGATITNDCEGAMWQGIEVEGRNNLPADQNLQGRLTISNGAVLQHARIAISNFRTTIMPRNYGGGIIKASDCSVRNCLQAVSLKNTSYYSYYNNSFESQCSFYNVTFLINDRKYLSGISTGYFSAWNIKGGVSLLECKFLLEMGWGVLPYNQRNMAISLQSAGVSIASCSISGFRRGIYATDYTGTPSKMVQVTNNLLEHNSENVVFAGDCFGQIQGNVIRNMYPATAGYIPYAPLKPVGIYLNSTNGATVNCGNLVDGHTDGGPSPTVQRVGLVAQNTGNGAVSHVTGNTFQYLQNGVQTQQNNPQLQLSCNNLLKNNYGISVNPQSGYAPAAIGNQGTGCGSNARQAGNYFSGNTSDIASYLTAPWDYFAGNESAQMPDTWFGNVTVHPGCGGPKSCNNNLQFCPGYFGPGYVDRLRANVVEFRGLIASGRRSSHEAQGLYTNIIRGFNVAPEEDLKAFLMEDDDDQSRKLLIPLLMEQDDYPLAQHFIGMLQVSGEEQEAYRSYYGMLQSIKTGTQALDGLDEKTFLIIRDIADAGFGVSPFAKSFLEWNYGVTWEHPVESLPMSTQSGKVKVPEPESHPLSALGEATPNPAKATTAIAVMVSDADAYHNPELSVRNVSGTVLFRSKLVAGRNIVDISTANWAPGIYFYSFHSNGKLLETKKLSIIP